MKNHTILLFTLACIVITGCTKKAEPESIYKIYYSSDNPWIGYSAFKENFSDLNIIPCAQNNCVMSDSVSKAPIGSIAIIANNYDLAEEKIIRNSGDFSRTNLLKIGLFNQNINFLIKEQSILQNGDIGIVEKEVSMLAPSILQISFPQIESVDDLYPKLSYKDFKLKWNADINNPHGIMITVFWSGDTNDKFITNTTIVVDNGKTILKETMFDGIPDNASVYITLLRCNNMILNLENKDYCLVAETNATFNMFLTR